MKLGWFHSGDLSRELALWFWGLLPEISFLKLKSQTIFFLAINRGCLHSLVCGHSFIFKVSSHMASFVQLSTSFKDLCGQIKPTQHTFAHLKDLNFNHIYKCSGSRDQYHLWEIIILPITIGLSAHLFLRLESTFFHIQSYASRIAAKFSSSGICWLYKVCVLVVVSTSSVFYLMKYPQWSPKLTFRILEPWILVKKTCLCLGLATFSKDL